LGLQHAHEEGLVHRDIKPANLMLSRKGDRATVKVLDFGLAKVAREEQVDGGLTTEGQALGTPDYIAPEQIFDAPNADVRADIYSLGGTLYYLLTGRPPFEAKSVYDIYQAHISRDADPLNLVRPEVPAELAALVAKMMAKDRARRFQTPGEAAQALVPFFKRGNLPVGNPQFDVSLGIQNDETRPDAGGVSTPTQPATDDGRAGVRAKKAVEQTVPERRWEGLIDLEGNGRSIETAPDVDSVGRPPSPPWQKAILASLFGLIAFGAIVIIIKNRHGETVITAPAGSTAKVDPGGKLLITTPPPRDSASASDSESVSNRNLGKMPQTLGVGQPATPNAEASGFVRLFNGKDKTGWKTHPSQPGNWHVANGVLIGSGPAISHLYTERGNYADYHLRVEARFLEGGRGGVYLRCPFGPTLPSSDDPKWPDGFKTTINSRNTTGGIYPGVGNDVFIDYRPVVPSGQWFTMEVIADGNALAVQMHGRNVSYRYDGSRLHRSGHIALQQESPQTVIEFRTIEIKELNRPDLKDPREIRRFPGTTDPVTRVAFSPDGLGILSGGNAQEEVKIKPNGEPFKWGYHNYLIRLWTVASGKNEFTREGLGLLAVALAFSSDGRYAASAENSLSEKPVLIWDPKTGKIVHRMVSTLRGSERFCIALSFSAAVRRIMAATKNGEMLSWDLVTEREQPPKTLETGPISPEEFRGAAFTPDRQHLVTASQSRVVELWDLVTGKKLKKFAGHTARVNLVACSADGRLILSSGGDKTIRLWDVASGKELQRLESDGVRSVAISPDGRRALSAGMDGTVHLWDLESGKEVCRKEGHAMRVNSVAFSPDGRLAVSGCDDTTMRLWQLPN
jgi:serine/threonine protein kinase